MQLWLQDPHSVEKLMDMKRLEKKGPHYKLDNKTKGGFHTQHHDFLKIHCLFVLCST